MLHTAIYTLTNVPSDECNNQLLTFATFISLKLNKIINI